MEMDELSVCVLRWEGGGGHASPAQRQAGINCQANGSRHWN